MHWTGPYHYHDGACFRVGLIGAGRKYTHVISIFDTGVAVRQFDLKHKLRKQLIEDYSLRAAAKRMLAAGKRLGISNNAKAQLELIKAGATDVSANEDLEPDSGPSDGGSGERGESDLEYERTAGDQSPG